MKDGGRDSDPIIPDAYRPWGSGLSFQVTPPSALAYSSWSTPTPLAGPTTVNSRLPPRDCETLPSKCHWVPVKAAIGGGTGSSFHVTPPSWVPKKRSVLLQPAPTQPSRSLVKLRPPR